MVLLKPSILFLFLLIGILASGFITLFWISNRDSFVSVPPDDLPEHLLSCISINTTGKNSVVFTYLEPTMISHSEDSAVMIALWKRSWEARGWTTKILTREDALKHPRYDQILKRVTELPTVNYKDYEIACFIRWVAIATVGGGFMSDYDVINYSFDPIQQPQQLTVYHPSNPGLVGGTSDAFEKVLDLLLYNITESNYLIINGKPHYSDMYLFVQFQASFAHVSAVQALLGEEGWQYTAPLVHFFNSGVNERMIPQWQSRCRWHFILTARLYPAWGFLQFSDYHPLLQGVALALTDHRSRTPSRALLQQAHAQHFTLVRSKKVLSNINRFLWWILLRPSPSSSSSPSSTYPPWINYLGLVHLMAELPNPQQLSFVLSPSSNKTLSSCDRSSPFVIVSQAALRQCAPVTSLSQCIDLLTTTQNCTVAERSLRSTWSDVLQSDMSRVVAVAIDERSQYAHLDTTRDSFVASLCNGL